MSKEQTPITAEEFLEQRGHDKDVICETCFGKPYQQDSVSDLMEQYAQAKVLEALKPYENLISRLIFCIRN